MMQTGEETDRREVLKGWLAGLIGVGEGENQE